MCRLRLSRTSCLLPPAAQGLWTFVQAGVTGMGATGYFTASPELIEQIGTGLGVSRCALGCFHRSHQNGAVGRLVRLEQVCSCCVCGACSALPAVPWRHLLLHRRRSGSMVLG